MFEPIKNIFRRHRLKKHASDIATGFLPMDKIRTANVVIDVAEQGYDLLKERVLAWGRESGIKVNIYFFDFRKLSKDELLLTSISTTIIRKELDWIGVPPAQKTEPLFSEPSDLFISLVANGDFPIDYLSKCTKARFKIGRFRYSGDVFDMVFSGAAAEELRADGTQIFDMIADFLKKIQ